MSEESKVYQVPVRLFCAKPLDARYFLENPFNFGRNTYATDGRILVRTPIIYGYERPATKGKEHRVAQAARDLFKNFPKTGFVPINIPKKKDVPKNKYGRHIARIGVCEFDMRFLIAMKRLPNLKVLPPTVPTDILSFRFHGGIGRLMPTLAEATYTILPKQQKGKHAPPKEKTKRAKKRAAIPRRRKRR